MEVTLYTAVSSVGTVVGYLTFQWNLMPPPALEVMVADLSDTLATIT
jgi:hypothetical protein